MNSSDNLANVTTFISFFSGISVVFGSVMNWFDTHAMGVGAIVAVATFFMSWHYQRKNSKLIQSKIDEQ